MVSASGSYGFPIESLETERNGPERVAAVAALTLAIRAWAGMNTAFPAEYKSVVKNLNSHHLVEAISPARRFKMIRFVGIEDNGESENR
ncbi:MAG TPA: hypothetical protein DCZ69_04370 [Syntrophobacteraceae bacterium]|jgi:hypothetical protein|nr:hypothetical protein [Syntrophobacteraceae bacterium]HBD07473.1 hypothetical protein [Syntrophobacteraceae bacterium]HBZ54590.1 hypothetical protein [Syntrophobacteraceae bacterium]